MLSKNPGDGIGFAAWPAYRITPGEMWSMQLRLNDCYRQQRFPYPGFASDVTVALGVYMGVDAKGAQSIAPARSSSPCACRSSRRGRAAVTGSSAAKRVSSRRRSAGRSTIPSASRSGTRSCRWFSTCRAEHSASDAFHVPRLSPCKQPVECGKSWRCPQPRRTRCFEGLHLPAVALRSSSAACRRPTPPAPSPVPWRPSQSKMSRRPPRTSRRAGHRPPGPSAAG